MDFLNRVLAMGIIALSFTSCDFGNRSSSSSAMSDEEMESFYKASCKDTVHGDCVSDPEYDEVRRELSGRILQVRDSSNVKRNYVKTGVMAFLHEGWRINEEDHRVDIVVTPEEAAALGVDSDMYDAFFQRVAAFNDTIPVGDKQWEKTKKLIYEIASRRFTFCDDGTAEE